MAAASSSSPRNKYDVFLSFRGEETRHNFTSHLYEALCQKNIETFIDDQLIRGNEISQSLLDTIEASMISLIIFSEGYASSRWCLDELVRIFECKNKHGQIVIPVFYGVDPSHVRKQTGIFGDLFSKLEHQWGPEKMQIWRTVLTEAANLSGFDSHNIRPESKLIKEVVNHIMESMAKVIPSDNKGQLVGVESTVKEIESQLELGSDLKEACTLGIWGIGGIGKTTIARAIFDKISNDFEGSCFLQNVREESERPGGLSYLQRKLVLQLLGERDENVIFDHLIFRRLSRKKVLIILDDVTCFNQIESIIGSFDRFMHKSRIIITTRDKQVLRNCGVKKIYEMKELKYHHALELFSRHAFNQNHPEIGYGEQSMKVINFAKGVPLAIKVLGCFLFERKKEVWESAIKKLEKIPPKNIQEILKISYDGLDDKEKSIFLDVACFLKDDDEYLVMKFLNESDLYPEIGISVLIEKSLIIREDNKITMHDLLQKMGWEIVRQEFVNDPRKRSRLCDHEDIINVWTSNMGTEAIKGICLDMGKIDKEICLHPDTFSMTPKLKFLKLYSSIENGENKFKVPYFRGPGLAEVRYLHWHGYPLKSLPSNIHLEKLVSLEMPHSNIEQLRNDVQHHGNLNQIITTTYKKLFSKIPNPSLTPHPNKLVTLNLHGCKNLKSIPAITNLESLKELDLSGCSKLKRLPEISSGNIEMIRLDGTAIEELPSSIDCLSRLCFLSLGDCTSLKILPSNLDRLMSLESVPALLSSNEYRNRQWIDLSENFKLDGNDIVKDTLQKLQLKATVRWKHVAEEVYCGKCTGFLILPGNEIPRWFRYQSMGSSVSLKGTVPGLFNNNKVIGFVFCAVLAFQPHHHVRGTWLSGYYQFKYESNDADRLDFKMWHGELACSKSDHICLGYHFFDYEEFNDFKQLTFLPDTFHIYFKERDTPKPLDYSPVKFCGIHFFYLT